MQKIAIFDLDGTLADTIQDLADAVNFGLNQLELPLHSLDEYKTFVGNGIRKLCFRSLPDNKKNYTDELLKLFSDYYEQHCLDKTKVYNGIHEVLIKLSENNVRLAVATNKAHEFAVKILHSILPDIKFDKILGNKPQLEKKPNPQVIREILSDYSEPYEAYMIGDSSVDIQTAKNAGIKCIGCTWGFNSESELCSKNPDHIVSSPAEIANIILCSNV